jgi:hypothetical protein
MVIKTKRFHKSRKHSGSRKYKTMKGGSNMPHIKQNVGKGFKNRIPAAFSIINNSINSNRRQDPRLCIFKNKFYKNKALTKKKLAISAPQNLKITSSRNQLSGHFNGSKFYFHKNNQPSQVGMVREFEYDPGAHYQGNSPMQPTGKIIENEV